MSLIEALLHCTPSQVTLDQLRRLVSLVGPEAPTVEYKANMSSTLAKGVAALANTYGGLLLVGVTDERQIVGVKEKTIESVSQHCHSTLEPPWAPEIIPVSMDDDSGKFLLVLRVVPGMAPRPLLFNGAAPIRNHNTTYNANWQQLATLFTEESTVYQADPWSIKSPDIRRDHGQREDIYDLVIRTGLDIAIDPRARWRPLREDDVDQLAEALNQSALHDELVHLTGPHRIIEPFHRRGHNQSHAVRLHWRGFIKAQPKKIEAIEAILSADIPGGYGQTASRLLVHLDVLTRFEATSILSKAETDWRMTAIKLGRLIEAMIGSLVNQSVVGSLANLAHIHALAVPQPRVFHIRSVGPIAETIDLDSLERIPGANTSYGAHLLADPAFDLADAGDRHAQVKTWLVQTAMDAGLLGMEQLLTSQFRAPSQIRQKL
ncbi:AlbA family DNA-binding domain-containing protein [Actinomadura algeriensis]|uniref:Schlafen AlbA-2 domain-containing protein n=1 Tax=Actinomadura algeriensis TaxID=1679523 RepID=A0ABR9K2I9_9ACTN|nr:ATP-binding protein [Actinomadura algeriensis]MBE1537064.1 hypothetical protein [Actinomadura algeriensis]